jgi:hypothetical protein
MKSRLCLLCALFFAAASYAQELNTLTEKEKADGWKLLFDGKTLTGWNSWRTKKQLEADKWSVADAAIALNGRGGGDIYTAEPYEHYELALEWKSSGNSGIFIRVNPAVKGAIYGPAPEMQIMPDHAKALRSTDAGGLYALYEIQGESKVIHKGGWNSVRIRIVNNKATHWLNGQKLYEYEIGSEDWTTRLMKSKFKKNPTFGTHANGHIGFQDHGHAVAFRNIKIRVLDAEGK